ncbi:gidB: 16S rRNA (guanine(527)-N(7))-methyltransferase GidB [Rubrobacter radiotolerans]|uniref:Ribosomal RNA small subunit methyltransferase G n=1 Tax=Rubrobacter radiotolerans TaxID=42256 RepID=A0A023X799_RUBRA|nr:gidB: 16S rRNA (guanine(527)-N(7))-methyltransferase GidB [Rubrobacter radiotolerans]SMC08128.1 16S rRNA m(7)G-527 methyltransferase [Rubrobacter radiotolerans DSM 5868]
MFHVKHAEENATRLLDEYCSELNAVAGFRVESAEIAKLARFAVLLSSYKDSNVVGTRDLEVILAQHVMDSLSCLQLPQFARAERVVDIGSGAGLPGIPLAICRAEAELALIESTGKKVRFQRQAVQSLQLENVLCVNGRVEEVARENAHRGSYQIAVSRALGSLPVLAEYGLPLVEPGGLVVCMKGKVQQEEMEAGKAALRELGGELCSVERLRRLGMQDERQRSLVVLRKTRETPDIYPRKTGVPAKKPLGQA